MKETPNKDNPEADMAFVIEELLEAFNYAEVSGDSHAYLESAVGSKFHARILNAAQYLKLIAP